MNSSGIQFDEEQHIDGLETDRLHREKIAIQDLFLVMPRKAAQEPVDR